MKYQVPADSEIAVVSLTRALEARGLRVYLSFDLRSAVGAIRDCGCPHHGTDQCTCQYAVLLVYGQTPPPVQVVVHGRDGKTWFSVLANDNGAAALQRLILDILMDTFMLESSQHNCSEDEVMEPPAISPGGRCKRQGDESPSIGSAQ